MTATIVQVAEAIATSAHEGQRDKVGQPYISHPARVADRVRAAGGDEKAIAAAWLHDVLEDTDITSADLAAQGIPEDVITAVLAVTKRNGESAPEYFERINADRRAIVVKTADLADNTDPTRTAALDPATRERLAAKYAAARTLLAAVEG